MGTRIIGLAAILAFFVLVPTRALAQPAATGPSWDIAITAGSFNGYSTRDPEPGYGDDWHHAAEWRLSAGRYWTPHLKTEVEFGATSEGERYTQRLITVPGSATRYPYTAQQYVRVRQGCARVTWQLLDNQWVHPYLSAGVSVDEERTRTHVYAPVYAPRSTQPVHARRRRHGRTRRAVAHHPPHGRRARRRREVVRVTKRVHQDRSSARVSRRRP